MSLIITGSELIQLAELAAYTALKLRKTGQNDDEIMVRIKAMAADAESPQALIDALLGWVAENEAAIDKKIADMPE
jgi:hypothetical protein